LGGGTIVDDYSGEETFKRCIHTVFMQEILDYCHLQRNEVLAICRRSMKEIPNMAYLEEIWQVMQESIKRGMREDGVLPGELNWKEKRHSFQITGTQFLRTV
jgi:L-serine dehydratase